MPQSQATREFKFVGGPSRKRRRCAAPSTTTDAGSAALRQTFDILVASTDKKAKEVLSNRSGKPRDGGIFNNDDHFHGASSAQDSNIRSQPAEMLESLLERPTPPPDVFSISDFNDSFLLFNSSFDLSTPSMLIPSHAATPSRTVVAGDELLEGDQDSPVIEGTQSSDSSKSTEEIERDDDLEFDNYRAYGNRGESVYSLFAQCKIPSSSSPLSQLLTMLVNR